MLHVRPAAGRRTESARFSAAAQRTSPARKQCITRWQMTARAAAEQASSSALPARKASFQVALDPCPPCGLDITTGIFQIDMRDREDHLRSVHVDGRHSEAFNTLLRAAVQAERAALPEAALACLDCVLGSGDAAAEQPSPQLAWVHQCRTRHLAKRGDARGALEAAKEELAVHVALGQPPAMTESEEAHFQAPLPAQFRAQLLAAPGRRTLQQIPVLRHLRAANRAAALHYRLGELEHAQFVLLEAFKVDMKVPDDNDINSQHSIEIQAMVTFDQGRHDEAIEKMMFARGKAFPLRECFLCCPSVFVNMLLRAGRREEAMKALAWAAERQSFVRSTSRADREAQSLLKCARQL